MSRSTSLLTAELRHMIADEIPLTLHLYQGKEPQRSQKHPDPSYGNSVGLPFTNPFQRYLGHSDGWGSSRPGMRSILAVDEWCRSKHSTHARRSGPWLCARLLILVAYWRRDLPDSRLEPMLASALRRAHAVWSDRKPERLDEALPYQRLSRAPAATRRRVYTARDGRSSGA